MQLALRMQQHVMPQSIWFGAVKFHKGKETDEQSETVYVWFHGKYATFIVSPFVTS